MSNNWNDIINYREKRARRLDARMSTYKDADADDFSIRIDDEWKTIKGTHVLIGENGNIEKGPVALKNLTKKSNKGISSAMRPKNSYEMADDDGIEEFRYKNAEKLMPMYDEGQDVAIDDEYYKERMARSTKDLHRISVEDADEAMYDNVRQGDFDGWYREANSDYKPRLVESIIGTPEARNAGLNLAYENYLGAYATNRNNPIPPDVTYTAFKREPEKYGALSFNDFLVTPIEVYRGGSGQKHLESDVFSAYTFDRSVAEKFHDKNKGKLTVAKIRPIDTFGSMRSNGEAEIWVPRPIAPEGNTDSTD